MNMPFIFKSAQEPVIKGALKTTSQLQFYQEPQRVAASGRAKPISKIYHDLGQNFSPREARSLTQVQNDFVRDISISRTALYILMRFFLIDSVCFG